MLKCSIIVLILLCSATFAGSEIHWFKSIPATNESIESVRCIPEKKSILISYGNQKTAEWDYEKLKLKKEISGVVKAISPDGKSAIFVESDRAVIRTFPNLAETWHIKGTNFNQVLFSAKGQFLAVQQLGMLTIWLTSTHNKFLELQPSGRPPADFDFSSNEQFLAISQYDQYAIAVLDLKSQKPHETLNAEKDTYASGPLINPRVAFHKSRPILAYSDATEAHVRSIFNPTKVCHLNKHNNFITHLQFLKASDEILTSGGRIDPRIIIWQHDTCKVKAIFDQHQDAVSAIDYVNETGIISGDESGQLYAWDSRFPDKAIKLTGHKGIIMDLTVCAPDNLVALSDEKGRVNIWRLPTSFGASTVATYAQQYLPAALAAVP